DLGELLREHAAKPRAELFAADAARGPRRIGAKNLEPAGLRATEALYFEGHALRRALRHTEDPPDEVSVFGPEVDDAVFAVPAQLAMQAGEFRQPLAIF